MAGENMVSTAGFVIGIGLDLVDIRRIDNTLTVFGERFQKRLFSAQEIEFCNNKPDSAAAFARHYAMKEACSKALGTGMRLGVAWRDMSMFREKHKKPEIKLTGGALARLKAITPDGYEGKVHVSITDEPPYAAAIVTISAVPINSAG
ncbi:MAG: holo-ACP synthase [Alphaproteobacteria bacterium]